MCLLRARSERPDKAFCFSSRAHIIYIFIYIYIYIIYTRTHTKHAHLLSRTRWESIPFSRSLLRLLSSAQWSSAAVFDAALFIVEEAPFIKSILLRYTIINKGKPWMRCTEKNKPTNNVRKKRKQTSRLPQPYTTRPRGKTHFTTNS